MPSVTVVVCTRDRPRMLDRCLRAVCRLDYPFLTVVVVDNAPKDDGARSIAVLHGAEYRVAPIRGVSRARNAGARACTTEVIAYLDDDMVPHRQWLSALVAEFVDPAVMAACGPVLSMKYASESDPKLEEHMRTKPWGPNRFKVGRDSRDWFERANFGGLGDGNMAFRREIFARWPGFEERIGRGVAISGGEEHYAFFSIIDLGYRVAYTPRAVVFHPDKESTIELKLRCISESSAYATFLATRHPRFAWRIVKFFLEAALAKRRRWRISQSEPALASVPKLRALRAFLAGSLVCRRALLQARHPQAASGAEVHLPG